MKERSRIIGPLRNIAVASAIIPFSLTGNSYDNKEGSEPLSDQTNQQQVEESFLGQLDEYLETDYGKALAASLFTFSVASSIYRIQKSWEVDSERKLAENVLSSSFMIALSSSFLAQTEADMDPRITSGVIDAFTLFNSVYMLETVNETDRESSKKLSALATIASLAALSSIITVDSFKNS
jgi:hypothetical protein